MGSIITQTQHSEGKKDTIKVTVSMQPQKQLRETMLWENKTSKIEREISLSLQSCTCLRVKKKKTGDKPEGHSHSEKAE